MTQKILPLLLLTCAVPLGAQSPSTPLFPQAFLVEHHLVVDDSGAPQPTEAVKDTYFGSWIVSERPDGSRMIVDLERRELTEIRPEIGQYWTIGFDRMAEIRRKLVELDVLLPKVADAEVDAVVSGSSARGKDGARAKAETKIEIEELGMSSGPQTVVAAQVSGKSEPMSRPGVQRLRVSAKKSEDSAKARTAGRGDEAASVEVWLDPSVRLSTEALRAVAAFENDALGPVDPAAGPGISAMVAAARQHGAGAFPIKTVRSLTVQEGDKTQVIGQVEDRVTRLEAVEINAAQLLQVPEGLRKGLHPLEGMLAFAQEDALRRRETSGLAAADN